jgi:dienelactone hydrolase
VTARIAAEPGAGGPVDAGRTSDPPPPSRLFEARYGERAAIRPPEDGDQAAWSAWRSRLRMRLVERLGIADVPDHRTAFETLAVQEGPGFRRLQIQFESQPGVMVPTWLLIPAERLPGNPAVVAVHGHGSDVNEILGLTPEGRARLEPPGYQKDFALELVKRGFLVAAPEMLGFGVRRERVDVERGPGESSCRSLATWALMLGTTLIGQRMIDLIRLIDLLDERDDVNGAAIGIMGVSGGATASLFVAALGDRLAATVLTGYVSSFRASVLAMEHCICNVVPGLVADAEMSDIALLLAPRPLLLEAGRSDEIFPFSAVEQAAARIARGYSDLGAPDRFEVDPFDGGHEVSGAVAYDFLVRWLGAPAVARSTIDPGPG